MTFKCTVCGGLFHRAEDPPKDGSLPVTLDVLHGDICAACEPEGRKAPRGTLANLRWVWDRNGSAR